jgi:tape measure domain-containing protein
VGADGNMTIWMRLRNAREVASGLRNVATQTGILGSSVDRLARHLDRAGRRTFIMNQALFTLRRYSYMLTLGLTAAAVGVVKWGFDYNVQVQNARVAFGKFGLTVAQTNDEIAKLYRIAAISPFLFTDITNTARRFLAFGMDLSTTNELVTNLADALTALGLATTASMNRASLALAHMFSLGRVTGQVVYQLARDNVPIIQALETELGLTGDQLRNVAALGIPASVAIQALNKYIEETPRFHNAALLFATRTWQGIVTTTRDYMAQFLGQIERPMFLRLQAGARNFLGWLTSARVNAFAARGDVGGVLGTVSPNARRVWLLLAMDMHSLWRILVDGVIPAFQTVGHYLFPTLYGLVFLLSHGLRFLSHHTLIAKLFFGLLALELGIMATRFLILLPLQTAFLAKQIVWNTVQRIGILLGLRRIVVVDAETGAIIANNVAKERAILVETRLGRILRLGMLGMVRWTAAQKLWTVASTGSVRGANGQFRAMTRLERLTLKMRFAFMRLAAGVRMLAASFLVATRATMVFLLTNPIGWAILVISTLVILYFKWRWFHNLVNDTFFWIKDHWKLLAVILVAPFAPFLALGIVVWKFWDKIEKKIKGVWGWLKGAVGWVGRHLGFGGGGGATTASYAYGGALGSNGTMLQPLSDTSPLATNAPRAINRRSGPIGGGGEWPVVVEVHNKAELNVDGKKMAETVSKHRLDSTARR